MAIFFYKGLTRNTEIGNTIFELLRENQRGGMKLPPTQIRINLFDKNYPFGLYKNSRPYVLCKKGVLKNFAKFRMSFSIVFFKKSLWQP